MTGTNWLPVRNIRALDRLLLPSQRLFFFNPTRTKTGTIENNCCRLAAKRERERERAFGCFQHSRLQGLLGMIRRWEWVLFYHGRTESENERENGENLAMLKMRESICPTYPGSFLLPLGRQDMRICIPTSTMRGIFSANSETRNSRGRRCKWCLHFCKVEADYFATLDITVYTFLFRLISFILPKTIIEALFYHFSSIRKSMSFQ